MTKRDTRTLPSTSRLLSFWFALALGSFLSFIPRSPLNAQSFNIAGMMQHSTLEGGCWYLQGNDGKHYELFGDSGTLAPLLINGAMVDLVVEPAKGASICMIGEMVRVLHIESVHLQPTDLPVNFMILDGMIHRTKRGIWYLQSKDGARYEFQVPPAKRKRHIGAHFHARARVLIDPKSTKEQMDGLILSDAPPPKPKMAPGKKYDSR